MLAGILNFKINPSLGSLYLSNILRQNEKFISDLESVNHFLDTIDFSAIKNNQFAHNGLSLI